jgi:hypothetical protein
MLKPLAEILKVRKFVIVVFGCTMLNASCLDKLDTKGSVDLYKKAIEDTFAIVALDTIKSLTSGKDSGFFKGEGINSPNRRMLAINSSLCCSGEKIGSYDCLEFITKATNSIIEGKNGII